MTIERCRFVGNNFAVDPQFSTIATISLREASDTASAIRDSEFFGNGIASGNSTLLDCSHALSYTPERSLTIERCTFAGNRARVLKSPLFGLDEDHLFRLAHDRGKASLFSRLSQMAGDDAMIGA
ncbi:MAG: hypothetical protein AAFQ17_03855, partial [Pseudomonadota bacterium]